MRWNPAMVARLCGWTLAVVLHASTAQSQEYVTGGTSVIPASVVSDRDEHAIKSVNQAPGTLGGFTSPARLSAVKDPALHESAASEGVLAQQSVGARSSGAAEFSLTNVEQIRLRVLGYTELSGEYLIHPNQTISVPGLGRVSVVDMSPSRLEQELGQKLSHLTRRQVTVAVEVARYRPYYITGQIAEPGAVQWQPGLMVIQAISLSGGVSISTPGRSPLVSRDRRATQLTRSELRYASAALARLTAERDQQDAIAVSDELAVILSSPQFGGRVGRIEFVARQNQLLREQRRLFNLRVSELRSQHAVAIRDRDAAGVQTRATAKQLAISAKRTRDLKTLKDQGYGIDARYHAQQSEEMGVRVRYSQAKALQMRLQGQVSSLKQQLGTMLENHKISLNQRIDATEREIGRLRSALPDAQIDATSFDQPTTLEYHLARETNGRVTTMQVTLFTKILPGDVVIVSALQRPLQRVGEAVGRKQVRRADALSKVQQIMEASASSATAIGRRSSLPSASVRSTSN